MAPDARYQQILDHLDEVVWLTDPEKEVMEYVNPAYEEVWGESREELYDRPLSFLDAIDPEDRARVEAALEGQPQGEYDEVYRVHRSDGDVRWIRDRAVPITDGEEVELVAGIAADITDLKDRERMLSAINEVSRTLLRVESEETVADLVVETATEALDLPLVGCYLYDPEACVLRPTAWSDDAEQLLGPLPRFDGSGSLVWEAFVNGATRRYSDVTTEDQVYNPETPIRSELIVPLGGRGVLLTGHRSEDWFDDLQAEFAESLAATATAALQRCEHEAQLKRQNERLRELAELNAEIRAIQRAIVNATARDEIEARVATSLCEIEGFEDSLLAVVDPSDEPLTLTRPAGSVIEGPPSEGESAERDITGGNPQLTVDRNTGLGSAITEAFRTGSVTMEGSLDVGERDLQGTGIETTEAALAVPLRNGEITHGVLVLLGSRDHLFAEEQRIVLGELGELIGSAISAVTHQQVLLSRTGIEATLEGNAPSEEVVALTTDLDCQWTLTGMTQHGEGYVTYYLSIEGASADQVRDWVNRSEALEFQRTITSATEELEAAIRGPKTSLLPALVDAGAVVTAATADSGTLRTTVEVPSEVALRQIRTQFADRWNDPSLLYKANRERPFEANGRDPRSDLLLRLTDRQRQALIVGQAEGYFEWPRESTAEECAGTVGVSSATFHYHLRTGLATLVDWLFEGRVHD